MESSSPHAWGTADCYIRICKRLRFIPTCVGNSYNVNQTCIGCPVHPHMRGEQIALIHLKMYGHGSSPHAWGTVPCVPYFVSCFRFIPTCVGNRKTDNSVLRSPPVHPHMRGEQAFQGNGSVFAGGSSPHAWGTVFGCSPYG